MSDSTHSENRPNSSQLLYSIDDRPPSQRTLMLAMQHVLTMFGATVSVPLLLAPAMGMSPQETGLLISCVMLCCGLATLLQSTIGSRLPIVQGVSFSFLGAFFAVVGHGKTAGWSPAEMMQVISGAILAGAAIEVVAGYSGLVGKLKRWVSPVVIGPVIMLIGLSLFQHGFPKAAQCLPIGGLTIVLVILFTLVLSRRFQFFALFPVISAVVTVVVLCWVLSEADVFYGPVRTDNEITPAHPAFIDLTTVYETPLVRSDLSKLVLPWGTPRFMAGFIAAALAGYLASMLESFGDYHACSYLAGAGEPTDSQISRGIGAEGLGCALSSLLGGLSTTSYSENIGVIGMTRVGSRVVVQVAGVILILLGIFGRFGAVAAIIPGPVVGGLYCTLFGLISAVGVQQLARADLSSNRTLLISGFSLFMGLSVPAWLDGSTAELYPPGPEPLLESLPEWLAEFVKSVGTTSMAVAAICGLILDNIVPRDDSDIDASTAT